jgi:hypothetical protein
MKVFREIRPTRFISKENSPILDIRKSRADRRREERSAKKKH